MRKGYLTVYLSLSLALILSFILTLIEGARISVIRMEAECVADIGMNSVLAEFHRELLEQYDLLFVDMSYGTASHRAENSAEHLRAYMQGNFTGQKNLLPVKDWLSLTVDRVEIKELSIASDNNGDVMKRQAVEYMQGASVEGILAKTIEQTEEVQALGLDTRDIVKEREEVQAQIDAIELPKKEDENGKQTEIALDNPADKVNSLRGTFILRMVLGNTSHVSRATIRPEDYVSHREKMTGIGIRPGWKEPGGLANQLLFDCYLFDKCGWYGSELEKSLLKYQIEYIIAGKDSDLKNLEKVMSRLIRWREVANVIYLFSDSEKCAQAEALAMTLTAVLQVPALAEPVKYSILFAWAYVESLNDARCLLKGGKVPLMKTASDWKTSIASILGFSWGTEGGGGGDSGHGMDYQEYLKIMLFMEDSKTKNMRAMDIMEMDIRLTEGNANFRIDACFVSYLSDISISSGFGYHCNIQKRYGYD